MFIDRIGFLSAFWIRNGHAVHFDGRHLGNVNSFVILHWNRMASDGGVFSISCGFTGMNCLLSPRIPSTDPQCVSTPPYNS